MDIDCGVFDRACSYGESVYGSVGYRVILPSNQPGVVVPDDAVAMEWHDSTEGVAELPNCRIAGTDPLTGEDLLPNDRSKNITPFSTIYLKKKGEEFEGGSDSGNPVIRQLGNSDHDAEDYLYEILPAVMRNYARYHAATHNMNTLTACASVVFGVSAALTKGVYVVTKEERVHPNLYVLNIAPSGNGKKAFEKPHQKVLDRLGVIEAKSREFGKDVAESLKKVERQTREKMEQLGHEAAAMDSEYLALSAKREELCKLATARKLAGSDDATPQFIARAITKPGQGGAFLISSGEGAMFFQRMGGRMKGATSYGTLLTKSFNDPIYVLSRVDEGEQTHERTTNPRLSIAVSIQNAKMADAVREIPVGLGVFQRFLYVVTEHREILSETASLFTKDHSVHPAQMAHNALLEQLTDQCWSKPGQEIELTFSKEAQELLDQTYREYASLAAEIEVEEPQWAEFVSRWAEQIIKLVQSFHVAEKAGSKGLLNWSKVQEPITRETLEKTIRFHDRWGQETRRFYDQWARPLNCNPGDTGEDEVQILRSAIFKAVAKKPSSEGADSSGILKYLPKWNSAQLQRVAEENPTSFKITEVGIRKKKFYLPIQNPENFEISKSVGGADEH